jgi:hypothetical protein
MKTMIVLLACGFGVTACLSREAPADSEVTSTEQPLVAPAALISTDESCRLFMERQRACSENFIPALVAARVVANSPPGLADYDRKIGREALVKEAFAEWADDSKDAAIDALCDHIAQSVPPSKDDELRRSVSTCLAEASCESFVPCAVPLNLRHWKE